MRAAQLEEDAGGRRLPGGAELRGLGLRALHPRPALEQVERLLQSQEHAEAPRGGVIDERAVGVLDAGGVAEDHVDHHAHVGEHVGAVQLHQRLQRGLTLGERAQLGPLLEHRLLVLRQRRQLGQRQVQLGVVDVHRLAGERGQPGQGHGDALPQLRLSHVHLTEPALESLQVADGVVRAIAVEVLLDLLDPRDQLGAHAVQRGVGGARPLQPPVGALDVDDGLGARHVHLRAAGGNPVVGGGHGRLDLSEGVERLDQGERALHSHALDAAAGHADVLACVRVDGVDAVARAGGGIGVIAGTATLDGGRAGDEVAHRAGGEPVVDRLAPLRLAHLDMGARYADQLATLLREIDQLGERQLARRRPRGGRRCSG